MKLDTAVAQKVSAFALARANDSWVPNDRSEVVAQEFRHDAPMSSFSEYEDDFDWDSAVLSLSEGTSARSPLARSIRVDIGEPARRVEVRVDGDHDDDEKKPNADQQSEPAIAGNSSSSTAATSDQEELLLLYDLIARDPDSTVDIEDLVMASAAGKVARESGKSLFDQFRLATFDGDHRFRQ